MLNITQKSINKAFDKSEFASYRYLNTRPSTVSLLKVFTVILIIAVLCMFLPWRQNIRSKGYVTTLNPYDKPQSVQSLTGGQIEKWYVTEGDVIAIGDTLVILTESKEDYLDPDILSNTRQQKDAKDQSADAYLSKKEYLKEQKLELKNFLDTKLKQLELKRQKVDIKISTAEYELQAAQTSAENAYNQFTRMKTMYDSGIKSLTDLESKKLSNRKAIAEQNAKQNKLDELSNELETIIRERELTETDYLQKAAKIESEIRTVETSRFSAIGESNKLQSKYNQIQRRQESFAITSPINGRVTKVLKNGVGEFVKAKEAIATLVPTEYQMAVELYILPYDVPLVSEGKQVRLQFDGWPAVVFSGWPNNSFGTFAGKVFAIDNEISENGKYRLLVVMDDDEKPWPDLIRFGSGTQGLLLLNEVSVGYEIWRKLNGFPPDFYDDFTYKPGQSPKTKAPLRKVK